MSTAIRMVKRDGAEVGAATIILVVWACAALATHRAGAAPPNGAMSTREAREDAVRAIPYAKLSRGARARVSNVLSTTTLYRRLPSQRIDCDPRLLCFLIEHPDLVVNIWEVLGISEVSLARVDQGRFEADDRAGTLGSIDFLYSSPAVHLLYAEGSYEGPLFGRPVRGKVLLLLRAKEGARNDGRKFVLCQVDAFLQMENIGASMLAKTFQPLVGAAADHNFSETAKFMAALNRAVETNRSGMRQITAKLGRVEKDDRAQFAQLTEQLATDAAMLAAAAKSHNVQTARKPANDQPSSNRSARRPSKTTRPSTVRRPTNRRMPR